MKIPEISFSDPWVQNNFIRTMADFDAFSMYRAGCAMFRGMPIPWEADELNDLTRSVYVGESIIRGNGTVVVSTDLFEDADDAEGAEFDKGLQASGFKVIYILSGGLCSPEERFAILQALRPGIEFGVEYDGYLTVYPDGFILDQPVVGALIAGPVHTETFASVCRMVTKVITFVGTDHTGRVEDNKPHPVNSKFTDVKGKLTPITAAWNQNIDVLEKNGVRITSLPPEIGRFTKVPTTIRPPIVEDQRFKARLLNLTSRLPPKLWRAFAHRITTANATVIGQWPPVEFDEARFLHGAAVAEEYIHQAAVSLSPDEVETLRVTVTYVLVEAALRGAVYLPGKFGSDARTYTDFLTAESIATLETNLTGLPTPMYDVAARIILFRELGFIWGA